MLFKLSICIFCTEKELLAYKVKGKDGILADEDSDGKLHSVIENIEYYRMQPRKQPIRQLDTHKMFAVITRVVLKVFYHSLPSHNLYCFQVFSFLLLLLLFQNFLHFPFP